MNKDELTLARCIDIIDYFDHYSFEEAMGGYFEISKYYPESSIPFVKKSYIVLYRNVASYLLNEPRPAGFRAYPKNRFEKHVDMDMLEERLFRRKHTTYDPENAKTAFVDRAFDFAYPEYEAIADSDENCFIPA